MTNSEQQISGAAIAMDPEQFRQLGYRAVDLAADYLANLPDGPVFAPMSPAQRMTLLDAPLPAAGSAAGDIVSRFADEILPHPMGNGHPRFFGWVNSPPSPIGMVAEFLAGVMGPSVAGGDHSAVYVERCAVRWLMELVGFPTEGSMGILVSGGSMASLTCIAAARHWAAGQDGWNDRADGLHGDARPRLVLYLSSEGHTTMRKAAELLGLGGESVRIVPVDEAGRMDVSTLRTAIRADRAAGLRPFCVGASAGTVSTGAVDSLDAVADLCAEERLWMHVDGAYGAVGVLDSDAASLFAGMDRADSLAIDPHKWLSVPVECGCALVRDGALLRDTFSLVPAYVRTEEGKGFGGLPWYSEYGFQQSRGFRALKLWMTLLHAGRDGVAETISRHNALARHLADLITATSDLELLSAPALSIVCFRYVPFGWQGDSAALDALNTAIMESIQSGGEAFVTQAVQRGAFWLRANIIHYATTEADLAALVAVVRTAGERLATSH